MALEKQYGIFGKVTTVIATKLKSFTFVPLLKRLPVENRVTPTWKKSTQTSRPNKTSQKPADSEESKAIYKAEVIYIPDNEDGEIGETFKMTTQSQIQSTDCSAFNLLTTLVGPHVESGTITPKPEPATMEMIDNKHPGISHLGFHNTSVGAEVNSYTNSTFQREEVLSPSSSIDFLTSPASSKESILFESWDRERSWSALHMLSPSVSPEPFSRTVSPCSSIRSGVFTPSVVRIKRHDLAPGSSLLQMSSCETPCCDSQATTPCPFSPHARHRPPPTQLSLLTAILRKGRLPVLSSALERPYTPCWPISSVSMTSCLACSAASAVSPINMSKAKSCSSLDSNFRGFCQNSEPQLLKSNHSSLVITSLANAPGKVPLKQPESFDSCRHGASESNIVLRTKHSPLTLPNLPTILTAPAYQSKTSHKDNNLSIVPGLPSCPSSCTMSPKLNNFSCYSSDSPNFHPKKQAMSSSDLSAKESFMDHLAFSLTKPAQSLCNSSFPPPKSCESHDKPASLVLSHTTKKLDTLLQNGSKSDTEGVHLSPSPRPIGPMCLFYIQVPPACPLIQPNLQPSTPEHCIFSSAIPRGQLSPSPSCSLYSSPSPSLWGSTPDCTDGKNRKPYKIKSSYKALAAIPTNMLLMEQQAIDDKVNKNEALLMPANNYKWDDHDPHSELCSPAQLRQQSAELYATIDEVLQDPIQRHHQHHVNKATVKSLGAEAP